MAVALAVLYLLAASLVWRTARREPVLRDLVDIHGINETPFQREWAGRVAFVVVALLWPVVAVRGLWKDVRRG